MPILISNNTKSVRTCSASDSVFIFEWSSKLINQPTCDSALNKSTWPTVTRIKDMKIRSPNLSLITVSQISKSYHIFAVVRHTGMAQPGPWPLTNFSYPWQSRTSIKMQMYFCIDISETLQDHFKALQDMVKCVVFWASAGKRTLRLRCRRFAFDCGYFTQRD